MKVKIVNRYKFTSEIWEVQMILYYILGILIDKNYPTSHWLAVVVWIWATISFVGVLVKTYQSKKYESEEDKEPKRI